MSILRRAGLAAFWCLLVVSLEVSAADGDASQISNLDQLLEEVRQHRQAQRQLNAERERQFLQDTQRRQDLLRQAKQEFESSQRENQPLLARTEANTATIAQLERELAAQLQDMGDIAGAFREFAGDFAAVMQESPITAQLPARSDALQALALAEGQPSIDEIETLWLLLQEDMTAAGKVVSFDAPVVAADGTSTSLPVVRIGTFTTMSERDFLRYIPETGELLALSRQPAARYRRAASEFMASTAQIAAAVVDPTHGSLLGMMTYTPSVAERIEQGGVIARIILSLGALGLLLTCWRSFYLLQVHRRVGRQRYNIDRPATSNPLGRILIAAREADADDEDLLQLKLDEAILSELPALERGNGLIKLMAAIAPLLGLLGTVTGMILTFQAISLFGTGDPKLMAGGISQALVTTVLGLVVAIPLLFGHSLVSSLSRSVIQRLDEQSAGLLARRAEQQEEL